MGKARQIFRPEALRRYNDGRERPVLPLLDAPRAGPTAWALLTLLCAALLVAAHAEVPVYVHGRALPSESPGAPLAVLLSPDSLSRLQVGQEAFMELPEGGVVVRGTVTGVAPAPRGYAGTDAPPGPAAAGRPAAIAFARFESVAAPYAPRASGAPRAVRIAVGTRRLGSVLTGDRW